MKKRAEAVACDPTVILDGYGWAPGVAPPLRSALIHQVRRARAQRGEFGSVEHVVVVGLEAFKHEIRTVHEPARVIAPSLFVARLLEFDDAA